MFFRLHAYYLQCFANHFEIRKVAYRSFNQFNRGIVAFTDYESTILFGCKLLPILALPLVIQTKYAVVDNVILEKHSLVLAQRVRECTFRCSKVKEFLERTYGGPLILAGNESKCAISNPGVAAN